MRSSAVHFAILGIVVSVNSIALGQCENKQLAKIQFGQEMEFGTEGVLEGSTALVVGSPNGQLQLGIEVPRVFERQPDGSWTFITSLSGSPLSETPQFGESVDLKGGRIAVGAVSDKQGGKITGAVFVFDRVGNNWSQSAKIVPDPEPGITRLGETVAIDGSTLFAYRKENVIDVYEDVGGSSWTKVASLSPISPFPLADYGRSIDLAGNIAAVGASKDAPTSLGSGAVYVYEKSDSINWVETAKLTPTTSTQYDNFGFTVSVSGNRILVGATGGSVFVFEKLGVFWTQVARLTSFEAGGAGGYGRYVSLENDTAVVTAPTINVAGGPQAAGAAYVYVRESNGSWSERMKLIANDLSTCKNLGSSVSASSGRVLLGAPAEGNPGFIGAFYEFKLTPNPIPAYGTACAGSGGIAPALAMPMSYDGCKHAGESVSLAVANGLGGSTCLLLIGASTASQTLPGGCPLLLIPSPANAVLPLFGSGPGNGSILVNATIPLGFPNVSLYMQGFIPDPGVPQGFSATNGLRLTTY